MEKVNVPANLEELEGLILEFVLTQKAEELIPALAVILLAHCHTVISKDPKFVVTAVEAVATELGLVLRIAGSAGDVN